MLNDKNSMDQYLYWSRFAILILLVGAAAGIGAIIFRYLIMFIHNIMFYGEFSITESFFAHAKPSRWGAGIIFVPVIGAFFVAFLVKNYAPEARGHGIPEAIDAIHYEHGIMRPIVSVIKSIASSISIGSGGSIGREGPIIQIGATFGSAIGQWTNMLEKERIILIACGAGAGLAATFNTPIGGVLFAIEVMLLELNTVGIIAITLATTIATYLRHLYFGNDPFIPYTISSFSQIHLLNFVSYFILGITFGLMSVLFIRCIYWIEDFFDGMSGNYYVRHMLGMLFVGISMYAMITMFGHYYIQGVGYATVLDVLVSKLTHPGFLLFLAFLKLVETTITLSSGGSGGVFSPLLFIGATLGAGVAGLCNYFLTGDMGISLQLGALTGMAGMVGASTGATLTSIVMVAEMTNNLLIAVPLMFSTAIAYAIRLFFIKDSVYTFKLTRRGHIIPKPNTIA